MRLLGIDFETQDDKPATTNITEVGASLWELRIDNQYHKTEGLSHFCYEPNYPPQTEKIIDITGITDAMLKAEGRPRSDVFQEELFPLMEKADIIFAHKKSFDQTILNATSALLGIFPPEKEWICTLTEFPWPHKFTCHKLSHLAYDHGIMVDPSTLHRAENDCDLMMQLITSKYNLDDILAYARAPWVYLWADVKGPWVDGGHETGIAKSLGFTFEKCKGLDAPKWPKKWVTRTKATNAETIIKKAPFKVEVIEGIA